MIKNRILILLFICSYLNPSFLLAQEQQKQFQTTWNNASSLKQQINDLWDSAKTIFTDTFILKRRIDTLMQVSIQSNYIEGTIKCYLSLSILSIQSGQQEQTIRYINSALQFNKKNFNNFLEIQAAIYGVKVLAFSNQQQYDSSIYYSLHQAKIYSLVSPQTFKKKSHLIYNNLAQAYMMVNNFPLASYYYDLAFQNAIDNIDSNTIATILINQGLLYYLQNPSLKEWKYAKNKLLEGLQIGTMLENQNIISLAQMNLATIHHKENNIQKAHDYLAPLFTSTNQNYNFNSQITMNLVNTLYSLKRIKEGDLLMNLMIKDTIKLSPKIKAVFYQTLANRSIQQKNFENALLFTMKSNKINQDIQLIEQTKNASLFHNKFETAQKDFEIEKNNLRLSEQAAIIKNKNSTIVFSIAFSIVLLFSIVSYIIYRKRLERKQLELVRWQASIEGEEKERMRIAKTLHDDICSRLSTVNMWFETFIENEKELNFTKEYNSALQLLGESITEIRSTAHHLMPELLMNYGLVRATEIFCDSINNNSSVSVIFRYIGLIENINHHVELLIYRTVQELVQNALKHANPSYVLVQYSQHNNLFTLTVEDNGIGIQKPDKGMGLMNITYNIEKLGGIIRIDSEPHNGTTIEIELKISES